MQATVWIGVVDHKHGTNLYAGVSEAAIMSQIAKYCAEWWDGDGPGCAGTPYPEGADDNTVVAAYFEYQSGKGEEWYLIEEAPLVTERGSVPAEAGD